MEQLSASDIKTSDHEKCTLLLGNKNAYSVYKAPVPVDDKNGAYKHITATSL